MSESQIRPGMYRHFKGGLYLVYGVAEQVDSHVMLVIYRPMYGARELVARPLDEFTGTVVRDGRERARFEYEGPPPDDGPAGAHWNNYLVIES